MRNTRTVHRLAISFVLIVAATTRLSSHAADEPKKAKGGGSSAERLHSVIMELDLSEQEKSKIEEQFTIARQRLDAVKSGADGRPRATEKIYDSLREEVTALLTETHKKEFRAKMAKLGNDPGAANGGPVTNLRENLRQVDLTDAQKDKIQDAVLDLKSKIGTAVKEGGADKGKNIRDLSEECKKKIMDLLTPEQKAKLDVIAKGQRPAKKP